MLEKEWERQADTQIKKERGGHKKGKIDTDRERERQVEGETEDVW